MAAGALGAGVMTASLQAAPLGGARSLSAATGESSGLKRVHWDADRYYYYYGPAYYGPYYYGPHYYGPHYYGPHYYGSWRHRY